MTMNRQPQTAFTLSWPSLILRALEARAITSTIAYTTRTIKDKDGPINQFSRVESAYFPQHSHQPSAPLASSRVPPDAKLGCWATPRSWHPITDGQPPNTKITPVSSRPPATPASYRVKPPICAPDGLFRAIACSFCILCPTGTLLNSLTLPSILHIHDHSLPSTDRLHPRACRTTQPRHKV